jgi:uncharacterized repeat protein (TIGR03806 family)
MRARLLFIIGLAVSGCQSGPAGVQVPDRPFDLLSEYGFFRGSLADLDPSDRVLPYDLNSPLFSDHAEKARFVWMPKGESAGYTSHGVLDVPSRTVLIKNFYYENDERDPSMGRNLIETRLLINRGEDWEAIGYIWNAEQTDAYREVIGDIQQVGWINRSGEAQEISYIVPNKNQCKSCHLSGKAQVPIGPKVANLNRALSYPDGEMNQLEKWASLGYLKGFDADADHQRVAVWDDENSGSVHDRALAYLDINCGHCHNPTGSANTSGLHLTADAQLDMTLGIYKAPVSAGSGTGGRAYSVVPGRPEESIMVYRMHSTDPAAMMPELGRTLVHEDGVALIRGWIREMNSPFPPTSTSLQ